MTAQEMIDVLSKLQDKNVELVALDGVHSYSVACVGEVEETQPDDVGYLELLEPAQPFVVIWID